MTGEIVEFPGREPPPEGYSEEYIDKLHSEAFRDLECEVSDLDRMGKIARNLIMNCAAKEDSFHDLELATCRLATGEDGERVQDQLSETLARREAGRPMNRLRPHTQDG